MKRKLIGICVLTLVIATALPAVGTIEQTIYNESKTSSLNGEWDVTFGGPFYEELYCVCEANDGGYIVGGCTEVSADVFHYWVLKVDSDGTEEWRVLSDHTADAPTKIGVNGIIQTSDGGFLVCGGCDRTHDFKYGLLWKLDATGQTQWLKDDYRGSNLHGDFITVIYGCPIELVDGYMVPGYVVYIGDLTYNFDGLLMKTDLNGDVVWQMTYDYKNMHNEFHALCATSDGGYLLGGHVGDYTPDVDLWLVKTGSDGTEQWQKTFGGSSYDFSFSRGCFQTSDGGYIINGNTYSYGPLGRADCWLLKTDDAGEEVLNKTYGEKRDEDFSYGMDCTSDGGFVFVATKNRGGVMPPRGDVWLVKTDGDGNVEWSKTFGGDQEDRGYHVQQTSDGGYIISGRTESFGAGEEDGWLIKTMPLENERPNTPSKPSGKQRGATGEEHSYTTSATDPDGDKVSYKFDWGDGEISDWIGPFDSGEGCKSSYSWESDGQYAVRVMARDENGGESDWSNPLVVTMPKAKVINSLFVRIFECFPVLAELLNL
jgi:hypothetical protein